MGGVSGSVRCLEGQIVVSVFYPESTAVTCWTSCVVGADSFMLKEAIPVI